MQRCKQFIRSGLVSAVFVTLILTQPAVAQLSLQSFTPANGTLNVGTSATFELTFSAGIDTAARFEEPEEFFLHLEFLPDSVGEPEDLSLSPDSRTVTVSGLALLPDTRYTILLQQARSLAGESLDRPYVFTFSTGSSLPSGSVSGDVSFENSPATRSLVALFDEDFGDEDPQFIGVATSQFTIGFVPDGRYIPIAIMDTNADGIADPSSGDALGFYDVGNDGQPDVIEIVGGSAISNVDITIVEPQLQTARARLADFNTAAQNWASDAVLVEVDSDVLNPAGQAFSWDMRYYSATQGAFQDFFMVGNAILSEDLMDQQPDSTELPQLFVDSDAVTGVAELNGGSDFRAAHTDAEARATLRFFRLYYDNPDTNSNPTSPALKGPGSLFLQQGSETIIELLGHVPVWEVGYYSENSDEFMGVEMHAETGELLVSDTDANLAAANTASTNWAPDAELIKIRNERELLPEGVSQAWAFTYYSASLDSVLEFVGVSGTIVASQTTSNEIFSFTPLPETFCNSVDAVALAQTESENFRGQHPDAMIFAEITSGSDGESVQTVWRISYWASEDHFEVLVDGNNCGLFTTSVDEVPAIPNSFALQQNHPNPFNPTTEIRYQVSQAGEVSLAIFNMLGQKIRTLVNGVQGAGAHQATWDGRDDNGRDLASGVYIYRLRSSGFSATKRMLLVR